MATCPVKSLPEWQELVISRGENQAYYLWDKYEGNVPEEYFQIGEQPMSKASESTLKKVKEAAKKMGIDIQKLSEYLKGTPNIPSGINALADLVKGVIAIAEGKEDVALTEEFVHIATAMLEQTHPELITEMISKIDKFKIYKRTLEEYKNNKNYQNADGKPNIRKIKKEAVDKLIAELIIQQNEGTTEFPELQEETWREVVKTWWNKILGWITGDYRKANIDIFEEVAKQVVTGKVDTKYYRENKEGVDFVFEQHPELVSIGSKEQYSEYLNNVFPESKVKDIVYHKTESFKDNKLSFDKFKRGKYGLAFYFTTKPTNLFNDNIVTGKYFPFLLDIKNPLITSERNINLKSPYGNEDGWIIEKDYHGWYIAFESEQIHILGSKQDIEGFREFVKNASIQFKGEGIYYQLSAEQEKAQKRILETRDIIEKIEAKEPVDPIFQDTEEASNYYKHKITGKKISKRVTDRVKAWYKSKFSGKVFSNKEINRNEFKRTFGIKGHAIFQEIHSRYFNPDGVRRDVTLERPTFSTVFDEDLYNKLETYFLDLVKLHTIDGVAPLIFSEEIIYDDREDEAGTLDLLIIDAKGEGKVYDWKFMEVSDYSEDIPWFKFGAFNIQLKRYREILQNRYGIKIINVNRAIPILMNVSFNEKKQELFVKGIAIGTVDASKIKDIKLVPISEEVESTGEKNLDEMISKLNAILKKITDDSATSDVENELRFERMNLLRKAIHSAQGAYNIAPLIEVVESNRKEGERLLLEYHTKFEGKNPSDFKGRDKELSDFSADLLDYMSIASVLEGSSHHLGKLIYNEEMVKDAKTQEEKEQLAELKDVLSKLEKESNEIQSLKIEIENVTKSFVDTFIGEKNLITGLLDPEVVVKGLSALFRGMSEIPLKSARLIYKMVSLAKGKAVKNAMERVDKILEIRKKVIARGGDTREFIQQLYQRDDKGAISNKLIHRFKKEFYNGLKENALPENRKKKWIEDNVDLVAYKKEADELLNEKIKRIKENYSEDEDRRDELILQEKQKWDFTRKDFNGWSNYILARHPQLKWESEQYLKIKNDEDLFALYNFIIELNHDAAESGYISNRIRSTFLPFVRKTMAESLAWDLNTSAIKNIGNSFKMNPDDVGYGKFNQIDGTLENSVPKYFTHDFTKTDTNENDFSEVSEDLFKNLILYTVHMEKYKSLIEIEGQVDAIRKVEELKGHLNTSRAGNVISSQELKGNTENAKLLDDFIRVILYDQKYVLSDSDMPLETGKVLRGIKKLIAKISGQEYVEEGEPSVTSLNKSIDAVNKAFQLKTLGFEILSGVANLFGTNIQLSTQSGQYFKAREIAKNEAALLFNKFKNDDEREMFIQLIEAFMPFKDDPTYDKLKEAGLTKLTRQNFSDILMVFMREPEEHVEKTIFLTLLENMMVVDGKIVSIPKYVRAKYKDRYSSSSQYKEDKVKIENEIEELKKTSSISATKKLVDGKLVIPGFDLSNVDEVLRLTTLTRRISRTATGGLSDADINRMSMNVWTRSMMVFKNWIPKLIDTRFGEFRKIGDDFSVYLEDGQTKGEQYDVGRIRLFFNLLASSAMDRSMNILNILKLNDKGLEKLDKLFIEYALDYKKRTGEDLKLSREEFIDLIRTNLRNQMKELAILTSLIGVLFSLGFIGPDDDQDKATKNLHSYIRRGVDRMVSELSFFYNPLEFQKILSGSTFPAIGLVSDFVRFLSHISMEITGVDLSSSTDSPEEVRKKAQPIKNLSRMLPITKPAITWAAMLSDEFSKEFDVTLQNQARR